MSLSKLSDLTTYSNGRLYNAATGRFVDGTMQRGYRKVRVYVSNKVTLQARAHRVIWYKYFGDIPEGLVVDHINGDRADNRIENLRLVNHTDNSQNCTGKGYYINKYGKYQAYIYVDYKPKHLGVFETAWEARLAYLEAKVVYHTASVDRLLPELLELRKIKQQEQN